ncbi:MAG TPA: hypothetical protein VGR81_09435 [Candidatus Acidoferrales bacterium]|nr:hypothetical protein [Candidatus Acidoferrales bacterium]
MSTTRAELAEQIEKAANEAFANGALITRWRSEGRGATTRFVKEIFGDLGKRLGFQVAANRRHYRNADEGEFLYDMVWYTLDRLDRGMLIQQAMTLESELRPGEGNVETAADVDRDFQKLAQARADVRVWVNVCPNADLLERHLANCKRQATLFGGAEDGDSYVLIGSEWNTSTSKIERLEVSRRDAASA